MVNKRKNTSERKERKRKTGRGTWENDIGRARTRGTMEEQEKMGKAGKRGRTGVLGQKGRSIEMRKIKNENHGQKPQYRNNK